MEGGRPTACFIAGLIVEDKVNPVIAVSSSNVTLTLSECAFSEDVGGVAEEEGHITLGECGGIVRLIAPNW